MRGPPMPSRRLPVYPVRVTRFGVVVLAGVMVTVAALAGIPGAALGIPPPPPPAYDEVGEGSVSPKFHPRRDGNRVFYAGSLKEARPWLPFTGVRLDGSFFTGSGLLAIFYRQLPGGNPVVT